MSSTSLFPGLTPGANNSGVSYSLPYAPQQGGQAALGGSINPFLPTTIGTGTSMPQVPQGAVSTNSTSGFPFNYGGYSVGAPGGSTTSTGSASSTPFAPTGVGQGLGFPTTTSGQHQLFQNLEKTYGAGLAGTIMQFLAGGAGYNQTAVNNMIAAMMPQFNQANQNLLQDFSAGGNRYSSGAQIGLSNLQSQESLDIGQLESQMYEQAISNYINTLMGVAGGTQQRIAGSSAGTSDMIASLAQTLGTIAGGL